MENNILTFIIHFSTSIIIAVFIIIGFKLISKFKGGLIAKFYKYIIYGSIFVILFHLIESLDFFGIEILPHGSMIEMLFEHVIVLVLYSSILTGTYVAYKEYKSFRTAKK